MRFYITNLIIIQNFCLEEVEEIHKWLEMLKMSTAVIDYIMCGFESNENTLENQRFGRDSFKVVGQVLNNMEKYAKDE